MGPQTTNGHHSLAGKSTGPPGVKMGPAANPGPSGASGSAGSDATRSLQAWGAAVAHLHAAGLPAAVPPFPAAWLARYGVRADWTAAA